MIIKNKMILIGGMPASGKTSFGQELCKKLKLPFLDKDIMFDKYTNFVVAKETFENDRNSPLYKDTLRHLEYEILFDVALSQVSIGVSPVLVSPFSSEFVDPKALTSLESKMKALNPDFELITILLEVSPDEAKKRMVSRGRKEDKTKLASWDKYIASKMKFQKEASKNVSLTFDSKNLDLEHIIRSINDSV